MLSKEDNERLTKVGPGTPMGEMLREFWTPRPARPRSKPTARRSACGCSARISSPSAPPTAGSASSTRLARIAACRSPSPATRRTDCAASSTAGNSTYRRRRRRADRAGGPARRVLQRACRCATIRCARRAVWCGSISAVARRRPNSSTSSSIARRRTRCVRCGIVHGNWLQGLEGQLDSAHIGMLHRSSTANVGQAHQPRSINTPSTTPRRASRSWKQPYGFREAALRDLARRLGLCAHPRGGVPLLLLHSRRSRRAAPRRRRGADRRRMERALVLLHEPVRPGARLVQADGCEARRPMRRLRANMGNVAQSRGIRTATR